MKVIHVQGFEILHLLSDDHEGICEIRSPSVGASIRINSLSQPFPEQIYRWNGLFPEKRVIFP